MLLLVGCSRTETREITEYHSPKAADDDGLADDLATELAFMRAPFYGLYLVSREDIDHKPALRDGEVDALDRCYDATTDWLAKSFATPPRIKPKDGTGDWEPVESHTLGSTQYLIPVDEFAEVELRGLISLTRDELRTICDQAKTKEAIIAALQRHRATRLAVRGKGQAFKIAGSTVLLSG